MSQAEAETRLKKYGPNAFAAEQTVPGDIVMLEAGDRVTADGQRYTISGGGYATSGTITRVGGKPKEQYPRVAEVPFDAAYKLMATFHLGLARGTRHRV